MTKPALILLPNTLGPQQPHEDLFPPSVAKAVATIDGLIAESAQGGRSFLNRFRTKKPPYDIPLAVFNTKSRDDEIDFCLQPILEGQRWGLISDCGLPCMADPGAQLVFRARQKGIPIEVCVGPSALIIALMLSGFPAQRFSFHGYLHKEPDARRKQLLQLEKLSRQEEATQCWIEAPFRNNALFATMLEVLHPDTYVAIAWDLTLETQGILCKKVSSLRKSPPPQLEKKPTVFLLYSAEF